MTTDELENPQERSIPVALAPTPTIEYRMRRKARRASVASGLPTPIPIPIPLPLLSGPRVLLWKQDPSVGELGIRKAYLPRPVATGPRDARITTQGLPPVSPNVMGDFIGPAVGSDAFDSIHSFTVVRQTLTMFQRAMNGLPLPWQWNNAGNTDPIKVFPHAGNMPNAFYSRSEQALKFFFFTKPGTTPPQLVFTCRSFDIVAHETGHGVLDGLKPNWIMGSNSPQTGGLHESFGDLTAIFLALSQLDQVEAIIAQTKANLHDKTFLADLAEEFGLALGRPNGLRNADNDFKLSQVGTEVHAISQVFTGGIYDVLADVFAFERKPALKDDAAVLYQVGSYLCSLLLRAIIAAPSSAATFADVVNKMLAIAATDGKPVQYRNFIRNRFTFREVVVSPTPLTADLETGAALKADIQDASGAVQDRSGCCGTMRHGEYTGADDAIGAEANELKSTFKDQKPKAA